MEFSEIARNYHETHIKHVNTLCEKKNQVFWTLKHVIYVVTTGSERVKKVYIKQSQYRPDMPSGLQEIEVSEFLDNRLMKVARFIALRTGRLFSPGNIPGIHFCCCCSQPQGHSAAGRVKSMKSSHNPIRNRTRDLPACSVVPHQKEVYVCMYVCMYVCVCVCTQGVSRL